MKQSSVCTIYLVRHGHSEGNEKGVFGTDPELTDLGKQQATELAEQLKNLSFDAIFSSHLTRAKQTAKIIALERKIAIQTNELLREKYWGKLEGRLKKEVRQELGELFEKAIKLNPKERAQYRIAPGVETEEEMMMRYITALREIAIAYAGKTVLIVSHSYVIRLFLLHIGYLTNDVFFETGLANSGYIKFESDGIEFVVKETQGLKKEQRWY